MELLVETDIVKCSSLRMCTRPAKGGSIRPFNENYRSFAQESAVTMLLMHRWFLTL